jgi:membrane protease YdiL (CAAX protease family)
VTALQVALPRAPRIGRVWRSWSALRTWLAPLVRPAASAVVLTAAFGGVVLFRWVAARQAPGEGLLVGVAFGTMLLVVALAAGWRPAASRGRTSTGTSIGRIGRIGRIGWIGPGVGAGIGAGLAVGVVLVALALLIGREQLPVLRPAVPFLPWLAVTGLVAAAEEIALRGALFDATERIGGPTAAILVTSVAFAIMHVPLYGPHVLLLDLGVGLALGGLRLLTGRVRAPAVAHFVADAATWWI